jgi:lipopolysaccharide heptosyltransferase II
VIRYDAPWLKGSASRTTSASDHAMIRILRARNFDAAIVFTVFSQSALPAAMMCLLADIPLRLAHARENPYQLLSDWVSDPEPGSGIRHEVERQLALVAHAGFRASSTHLVLQVPDSARQRARSLLHELGIHDDDWIVIHPGATAPSRRYPSSSFATAARSLNEQRGFRFLVTGSTDEAVLVDDVCSGIGECAIGLAGVLDLGTLAAVIEASPLLITNNSGPAHVAAAVGTPVVDLYALTNPQHTPWEVPNRVLSYDVPCRNCFKSVCPHHNDCLRRIPPGAVVAAALELLAERIPIQATPAAIRA